MWFDKVFQVDWGWQVHFDAGNRFLANSPPSMKIDLLVVNVLWTYNPILVILTDLAGNEVFDVRGKNYKVPCVKGNINVLMKEIGRAHV